MPYIIEAPAFEHLPKGAGGLVVGGYPEHLD